MGDVLYATREAVKTALDAAETSRSNSRIDRALAAASDKVEGALHRVFYPWHGTKYFDWPNQDGGVFRLWLDESEIIALDSITSGGISLDITQVLLEPQRYGPPYDRIEVNRDTIGAWTQGVTFQRSIAATGTWAGCPTVTDPAGHLVGLINSSVTSLVVSDSNAVGVGSILTVDTERMLVTEKRSVSTGQTLQADLADLDNATLMLVTDTTVFAQGEVLTLDSERVRVTDSVGSNLVVERGVDGTALAIHSGSVIYAARQCTVTRGALGTTAAAHADLAPVTTVRIPGLIVQYAIAETLIELEMQASAYARTRPTGTAGKAQLVSESGPTDIRNQALTSFGRCARQRAI